MKCVTLVRLVCQKHKKHFYFNCFADKGPESPSYPMSVSSGKPSLGPITSTDGLMATFDNANVPYPRSSGARFSANGLILVCFGRSTHVRPLQQNDSNKVTDK